MAPTPVFALNHIISPGLRFADFLKLAGQLGVDAVEIRNDLRGVEIEDGTPAAEVRRAAGWGQSDAPRDGTEAAGWGAGRRGSGEAGRCPTGTAGGLRSRSLGGGRRRQI